MPRPDNTTFRLSRAALLLSLSLVPLARGGDPAHELRLRSGTVDTSTGGNLLAALRGGAPLAPAPDYVLQLDGPITAQRRAALANAGIVLGDYLPENAYFADLRAAAWAEVAELSFIRWLGRRAPDWKVDATLGQRLAPWATSERQALAEAGLLRLTLTLEAGADRAATEAALSAAGVEVVARYRDFQDALYDVIATPAQVAGLSALPQVRFIEEASEAAYRNTTVRWIVQSNQLNATPLYAHGLHGEGQILGIIDGWINEQHCAFYDSAPIGPAHRKIVAYNSVLSYDQHGTHVAGTAVGDAGVDDDTRGVAYASRLAFSPINVPATQQLLVMHHEQGARVHNNSWGNDSTNLYDALARAIDAFAWAYEDDLVLFAATNQSTLRNPENAKNVLAVGASGDYPNQAAHCLGGSGPTLDGRRRPEIFAPGCGVYSTSGDGYSCSVASDSGTSMACPAMSGAALLARQYFVDGYYPTGAAVALDGFEPSAALIKAVLLNSAADMTAVSGYPNDVEGWGRVLANDALMFREDGRRLWVAEVRNADGLETGVSASYPVEVYGASQKLKVTLAWTDAPPAPEAAAPVVNNLDLEVTAPDGTLYRGNVFANGVSVVGGTADALNNVEQVHVGAPQSGVWTVRVRGSAVNVARQGFALAVTGAIEGPEPALRLQLLDAVPARVAPAAPVALRLRVAPGDESPVPERVFMHVRFESGEPFAGILLTPLGGEVYEATLPAGACGETLEFYFSAVGSGGTTVRLPSVAPAEVFRVEIAQAAVVFADDFEVDRGWSVSGNAGDGAWERGVPANGVRGDPPYDADGSGRCYLTRNLAGNSDVDDGTTILTSPVLAVSPGWEISYAYWLGDIATGPLGTEDALAVEFATNAAGSNWQPVRRYADALAAWRHDVLVVGQDVPASSTLRIRFLASDLAPGDVLEAGVDAFRVERVECLATGTGDFDDDDDVDLADFAGFQRCAALSKRSAGCAAADLNGDGFVSDQDIAAFVSRLLGPVQSQEDGYASEVVQPGGTVPLNDRGELATERNTLPH